ncbi:hypothetical protein AcV5_001547 [Taiwanofungus camphoratus]|nr:hypothetical protein AcV5_001547 [Antrodia cinnamomea]
MPFVSAVHAAAYWAHAAPLLPHNRLPEFLAHLETVRTNSERVFLAVIDKTRPDPVRPELGGSPAGVIALTAASPVQLRAELAFVLIFKAFQRTSHRTRWAS